MKLEKAKTIATAVVNALEPLCERIEVAGSIRRKVPNPRDIDLVLIPKDREQVDLVLGRMGSYKMSGRKIARISMDSIEGATQSILLYGTFNLDVYFATEETWATLLLIRTGSKENNIRLASLAKKKGWRLAASGDGLFNGNGERIAGDTEMSIYRALGLTYQEPWERE